MTNGWKRHGLLLSVKTGHAWWTSHAQAPCVLAIAPRVWRVYFSARNAENTASPVAVDLDPGDNMRVIAEHISPLLQTGPPGSYDHTGVGSACAIWIDGQVHLYTTGVHLRPDVRFQLSIGLALSEDGLSFASAFDGPVRATGPFDPFFASMPCVRRCEDGYRMWYVSGTGWTMEGTQQEPLYDIRTCRSSDGRLWEPYSLCALSSAGMGASAAGRPWVTQDGDGLRLWYSLRGAEFRQGGDAAYRIVSQPLNRDGVAVGSPEPVSFVNPPVVGDFDDWMQAYACIMNYENTEIMFYNGNNFGRAGIGWATRRRRER
ncbi:glycoside hydrolase family 32 protein [Rhizobium sp. JAB6]|uniref:glycoside hydrolase family 32 protein n=1 Tax=Rhizobium sp. JAB6 TaxID=2127050 RepID=UPI0011B26B25|nr:glycoside hydrolase family 32 protein [Rhizobium sp. JAB6]